MRVATYIFLLAISFSGFGQSIQSKSGFGLNGQLVIDIDDLDELVGVFNDATGNTYFYGNTSQNLGGVYPFDFFIGKMNAFGDLDPDFGDGGIYRGDFPGYEISSLRKAVLGDSSIYFIGRGVNAGVADTNALFVGALNLDGSVQDSFANHGFFTHSFLGTYNTPGSILVDCENRIVFCGSTTDDEGTGVEYSLIVRLNLMGELDETFGTSGILIWDYYSGNLVDGLSLPPSDGMPTRHGEGAYLSQMIEVGNSYFVCGQFINTAFSQLQMMSFDQSGALNENFVLAGPRIFQVDPGANHELCDIELVGGKLWLGLKTDGYEKAGSFLVQEVDTMGGIGRLLAYSNEVYQLELNAMEIENGQLFLGGYALKNEHVAPGYHSDYFCLATANTKLEMTNGLGEDTLYFSNGMIEDELGLEDFVFHAHSIVAGGYMNRVEGTNYTDLLFMSWELDTLAEPELPIGFTVYPNPTQDYIMVEDVLEMKELALYDLYGRSVYTAQPLANDHKIDLTGLAAGTYVLVLQNEKGIRTKQVVKV